MYALTAKKHNRFTELFLVFLAVACVVGLTSAMCLATGQHAHGAELAGVHAPADASLDYATPQADATLDGRGPLKPCPLFGKRKAEEQQSCPAQEEHCIRRQTEPEKHEAPAEKQPAEVANNPRLHQRHIPWLAAGIAAAVTGLVTLAIYFRNLRS